MINEYYLLSSYLADIADSTACPLPKPLSRHLSTSGPRSKTLPLVTCCTFKSGGVYSRYASNSASIGCTRISRPVYFIVLARTLCYIPRRNHSSCALCYHNRFIWSKQLEQMFWWHGGMFQLPSTIKNCCNKVWEEFFFWKAQNFFQTVMSCL